MHELHATVRQELGKKVKNVRKRGFFPAVLYGAGVTTQAISVPFIDFMRILKVAGESTLIELRVADKPYHVLIHHLAYDALRGTPIHGDFYAVQMDKKIRTRVPIVITGESPAVKQEGGIIITVMHELEIEALPSDLPHEIFVDVSSLVALESRLFLKDIQLSHGVRALADQGDVVVLVESPPTEMEGEGETPEAGVTEVKTEQELKRESKVAEDQEDESS
jgi:large subunit ribosomal protein L25